MAIRNLVKHGDYGSVAKKVGRSSQTFSRWMKHDDTIPVEFLDPLRDALGVGLPEFVDAMSDRLLLKAAREGWPVTRAESADALRDAAKAADAERRRLGDAVRARRAPEAKR